MQIDVAHEVHIDEMVALDVLVSGNEGRRHLITQTINKRLFNDALSEKGRHLHHL